MIDSVRVTRGLEIFVKRIDRIPLRSIVLMPACGFFRTDDHVSEGPRVKRACAERDRGGWGDVTSTQELEVRELVRPRRIRSQSLCSHRIDSDRGGSILAHGALTGVARQACAAGRVHTYTVLNGPLEIEGFVDHVRDAYTRGTITLKPVMGPVSVHLEENDGSGWRIAASVQRPPSSTYTTAIVEGYLSPGSVARLRMQPRSPGTASP